MNHESLLTVSRELHRVQKLVFLFIVLLTAACSPKDTRPGLWVGGEEATARVNDWRFTDAFQEIFIETRTPYLFPHSTTIWCVEYEGNLYLGSYGIEKKFWESNIERDPRARLNIDDQNFNVTVSLVDDEALTREIDVAYNSKYDMEAVFGDNIPEWWFYRVDQQL